LSPAGTSRLRQAPLPFSTTAVLAGRVSSAVAGKCGGFGGFFVRGGLMFSGQGNTATLRNHRCFDWSVIVGGGEASGAASAGFFVRGGFTFRGVK